MSTRTPQKLLEELVKNVPESLHGTENAQSEEANWRPDTEDGQDTSEDTSSMSRSATMIVEELVYPFELTQQLLVDMRDNEDSLRRDDYKLVLRKLYRSVKYWRLEMPKWLPKRVV